MSEYSERRDAVVKAQKAVYDFLDEGWQRGGLREGDDRRFRQLWAEFEEAQKRLDELWSQLARAMDAFHE